ncbi:protein shisa-8-like [Gadus morhua]|uniref:protein shisa-8-like n=1 Tax=Gadus morhua TaxID=8049 RepID=UPI0011B55D33|nr:protein shisa-8-like [Gadus morhua]
MAPHIRAPLVAISNPRWLLLLLPVNALLLLLLIPLDPALAQDLPVVTTPVSDDNNGELLSPPSPTNQMPAPSVFAVGSDAPSPETGLSTPASGGDGDDEDLPPSGGTRCQGYYDVMGQWDPPFNCNAGVFLYCCGTCFYRFCCQFRQQRLDQSICSNYDTPIWANTGKPVAAVTEGQGGQDSDRTHLIVYIICGVVAVMVLVGIFTKLGLEKSRGAGGGAGGAAGGAGGMGYAHHDLSNTRTLTELLQQPGGEVPSAGSAAGGSPTGRRANGASKMLRSRSEQYHLNNSAYGPFGPALPHPHSNHSLARLNKYTSLKAVADTAAGHYYRSYPLMDFSQYQASAAAPDPLLRNTEKSFLHPAPHGQHPPHTPLSISIPPDQLEHAHLPKATSHPASISSSAFRAWEPHSRQVQRQASAPGRASIPCSGVYPSSRRQAYSTRRQQSIENLPDLFTQPYAGAYRGGMVGGHAQQQEYQGSAQPPYYHPHHTRHKSCSTHSKTEVTV